MTESHADAAQPIDPGLARAINSYVPTDSYFGRPFIDADEMRDDPLPHRYIHGGFENTDTRFAIYFPEKDVYRGRFFQPLSGGLGGTEFGFVGPLAGVLGGIAESGRANVCTQVTNTHIGF